MTRPSFYGLILSLLIKKNEKKITVYIDVKRKMVLYLSPKWKRLEKTPNTEEISSNFLSSMEILKKRKSTHTSTGKIKLDQTTADYLFQNSPQRRVNFKPDLS